MAHSKRILDIYNATLKNFSHLLQTLQLNNKFILLDLALFAVAILMVTTFAKVLFFHVIFVLLTFGAFFWKFQAFAVRAITWVTITAFVVVFTVFAGQTQVEEIIEIPLLTAILILVFSIAQQRSHAEHALRHSEERYHTLFENLFQDSMDAIFITNPQGSIVDANQALLNLFGYRTQEEIIGLDYQKYLQMAGQNNYRQQMEQKGFIKNIEISLYTKDGTKIYCLLTLNTWRANDGSIQGYHGIIHDITERKQAEELLRDSEERYRSLVELSFQAVAIHRAGKFVYLNEEAVRLFGATTAGELINKSVFDFIHPNYLNLVKSRLQTLSENDTGVPPIEEQIIRLDGSTVDVEVVAVPITFQGQQAVQTVARDISRRKQAEQEREVLLATEREQRLLAQTLGEVFLSLTSQTSYEAVLDEILRQTQRIVSFDAANIMMLSRGHLKIAHHRGYETSGRQEIMANLRQALTDFPLDAAVIQSQQSVVVQDTYQNPQWVATDASAWIRSFIALPLCLQDRVLGLLRLDSQEPGKFSENDLVRLQPLANAAAIALDNARLYDEARQELAQQAFQAESEIIQLNQKMLTLQYASATIASSPRLRHILENVPKDMANLLNVPGCSLFKWDQDRNTISLVAHHGVDHSSAEDLLAEPFGLADYPVINRVLIKRLPQQLTMNTNPDTHWGEWSLMRMFKVKSLLLVPMEFQNRIVGLVLIVDKQIDRTFNNREIGLIQLLANQVASAIENNRLYNQLRQEIAERMSIEKELRYLATKNQAILDAISDTMLYLSRNGEVLDYKVISSDNVPLEFLREIRNGRFLSDFLPSNLVDITLQYINHALETNKMQVFGYELIFGENTQYYEIRLVVSGPNEVLAIVRDITQQKKQEIALEKQRARIARDLHDSLGQSLGYLRLTLDTLTLENEDNIGGNIGGLDIVQMRDVANEAYELVRSMLAAARPANSTDLATVLLAQARSVGSRARFKVQLTSQGQAHSLSPIIQQQVLYILKEALNNIEKHAQAQNVNLTLVWADDKLTITLSDDGCGFDTNHSYPEGHYGLTIMQERAAEINGNLTIVSNLKTGTELTLQLPIYYPVSQTIPEPSP